MKKTILNSEAKALNAKMVNFAGWEMPISFTSIIEEVKQVRTNAGVFDVSHMGEFVFEGDRVVDFINWLLPNNFKDLKIGKAQYNPLLNEEARILDDLIVYKLSEFKTLMCVNAANVEKDFKWCSERLLEFNSNNAADVKVQNFSDHYQLLSLQGPKSEEILSSILEGQDLNFGYYQVKEVSINSTDIVLARTGYTGEDGFEIFCDKTFAKNLWSKLMDHNVQPVGLAARDILRLEAGFPLYGNELSEEYTPYDVALGWTVKMDKENFIGRKTLEEYKSEFKLIKFTTEKQIPRAAQDIVNSKNEVIGHVTSGTKSPTIGKAIGIGIIQKENFSEDDIFVNIRGSLVPISIQVKPFVSGGHK